MGPVLGVEGEGDTVCFPGSFFVSLKVHFMEKFLVARLLPIGLLYQDFFHVSGVISCLAIARFCGSIYRVFGDIVIDRGCGNIAMLFVCVFGRLRSFF